MSPARTRRTVAAVVTVWVAGLLMVLGMWQQVDAACGDGALDAPGVCHAVPAAEPTAGATGIGD